MRAAAKLSVSHVLDIVFPLLSRTLSRSSVGGANSRVSTGPFLGDGEEKRRRGEKKKKRAERASLMCCSRGVGGGNKRAPFESFDSGGTDVEPSCGPLGTSSVTTMREDETREQIQDSNSRARV